MSGLAFRTYQDPTPDGPAFFRTQLLTELRAHTLHCAMSLCIGRLTCCEYVCDLVGTLPPQDVLVFRACSRALVCSLPREAYGSSLRAKSMIKNMKQHILSIHVYVLVCNIHAYTYQTVLAKLWGPRLPVRTWVLIIYCWLL